MRLEQHRRARLGDELGDVRADHVDAQQLVGLGVRDDLDEALVSPLMMALPLAWNGNLPTLNGMPSRSHSACVRPIEATCGPAVRRARHLQVVDRLDLLAGDRVDRGDALVGRDVRQPQPADDVADGVQVRLGRRISASTLTMVRSTTALVVSRPTSSVFAARPVATSIRSATQLGGLLALLADHEADARRRRPPTAAGSKRALGDDLDAPLA